MRNIFNFILKQYFFFLFLILEVIAFGLIIQNHYYQRSFFVNSANAVAGNIFRSYSNLNSYFSLKYTNAELTKEISELKNYTRNSFLVNDRQVFLVRDTVYKKQFSYINAKIINNSVYNRNNYITLDKGRKQGIEPDMGIITNNGVIGIVTNVSNNFASAISILHNSTQISARHKNSRHLGTLLWEGYDYKHTTMLYIPPHVNINIGDTIETSGYSHIFPEGIPIGIISDFGIKKGENFYSIKVELFVDLNKLEYVNVVKNLMKEEQITLEQSSKINDPL
jgi:rod shape-determining protein MreC